jgi:hypothetical protein
MEAVAAIGVAAAAVQFLDFSTKTLVLCKQIRDSSTGSTEVNAELTKSTKEIKEMQKELRQAGNTPSSIYRKLLQAVKDCALVADELLKLLEDFRELARKSFGAMRSSFNVLKDSRKIEKLQKRLADCREKFMIALTMDMREGVINLLEKQGVLDDEIRNMIMPKLEQLQIQSTASHSATHSQIHNLGEDLQSCAAAIHKQAAINHTEQQSSSKGILRGQRSLGKSINSRLDEASDRSQNRDFLESLYFDDMFARQQSIAPQSDGTYDWVLSRTSPPEAQICGQRDADHDAELHGRLLRWLQSDQLLFWVNGKAGSGKSSLMSFIEGDRRTEMALQTWSRSRRLYMFSFFFWRPGSPLQKSIVGLLRSILYQVTKAIPVAVAQILSNRPSLIYTDWNQAKLLEALKIAFSVCQDDGNGAIFLLIDGLDEFEGNYSELLDAILGLQCGSHIKLCVSSRPETTFVNKFETFPSISLQELNFLDIERHVADRLEPFGESSTSLIHEVTWRAEGIFLWAVLVCQSLIAGHEAGDDEETMARRLSIVPNGLEDLFASMFSKIDRLHRKDLALYFALMEWGKSSTSSTSVSIALVTRMTYRIHFESLDQFVDACKATQRRIIAQSKGLIHVYISDPEYDELRMWTFKDIATRRTRHHFLDAMESACMHECVNPTLQWIHRSAYDCLFGDSSGSLPFDITSMNESEFARRTLQACAWLAHYTPVVEYSYSLENDGASIGPSSLISDISSLITSKTSNIEDEGFQTLDAIHNAMQSSMFDAGEPVNPVTSFGPGTLRAQVILNFFWYPLASLAKYWTVRFERIKQSKHAGLIATSFLGHLIEYENNNGHQRRLGLGLLLMKFLLEEYLCESQSTGTKFVSITMPFCVCSWKSSGQSYSDDVEEVESLIIACRTLKDSSDPHTQMVSSEDYRNLLFGTLDAKQIFLGERTGPAKRGHRPLQILLPLQHVVRGYKTVFPTSFKRRQANLRLVWYSRRLKREEREADPACYFDLSVQLTSCMLEFCVATPTLSVEPERPQIPHVSGVAFAGTLQQREECLQLIMQEIWQNAGSQLDAWRQLLLLAWVKKCFSAYWKTTMSDCEGAADKPANNLNPNPNLDCDSDSDPNSHFSSTSSESPQQPTRPSDPYSASPSKHPSAKAPPHPQPDP